MQQYFTCCIYILEHCCINAREILLFINNYFCFSQGSKKAHNTQKWFSPIYDPSMENSSKGISLYLDMFHHEMDV
jgi:hypothetical protein